MPGDSGSIEKRQASNKTIYARPWLMTENRGRFCEDIICVKNAVKRTVPAKNIEGMMPKLKKTASKKEKKKVVKREMDKYKEGKLHSGSKHGPIVSNPKQAIAIALSESGQSKKKKKKK